MLLWGLALRSGRPTFAISGGISPDPASINSIFLLIISSMLNPCQPHASGLAQRGGVVAAGEYRLLAIVHRHVC